MQWTSTLQQGQLPPYALFATDPSLPPLSTPVPLSQPSRSPSCSPQSSPKLVPPFMAVSPTPYPPSNCSQSWKPHLESTARISYFLLTSTQRQLATGQMVMTRGRSCRRWAQIIYGGVLAGHWLGIGLQMEVLLLWDCTPSVRHILAMTTYRSVPNLDLFATKMILRLWCVYNASTLFDWFLHADGCVFFSSGRWQTRLLLSRPSRLKCKHVTKLSWLQETLMRTAYPLGLRRRRLMSTRCSLEEQERQQSVLVRRHSGVMPLCSIIRFSTFSRTVPCLKTNDTTLMVMIYWLMNIFLNFFASTS